MRPTCIGDVVGLAQVEPSYLDVRQTRLFLFGFGFGVAFFRLSGLAWILQIFLAESSAPRFLRLFYSCALLSFFSRSLGPQFFLRVWISVFCSFGYQFFVSSFSSSASSVPPCFKVLICVSVAILCFSILAIMAILAITMEFPF